MPSIDEIQEVPNTSPILEVVNSSSAVVSKSSSASYEPLISYFDGNSSPEIHKHQLPPEIQYMIFKESFDLDDSEYLRFNPETLQDSDYRSHQLCEIAIESMRQRLFFRGGEIDRLNIPHEYIEKSLLLLQQQFKRKLCKLVKGDLNEDIFQILLMPGLLNSKLKYIQNRYHLNETFYTKRFMGIYLKYQYQYNLQALMQCTVVKHLQLMMIETETETEGVVFPGYFLPLVSLYKELSTLLETSSIERALRSTDIHYSMPDATRLQLTFLAELILLHPLCSTKILLKSKVLNRAAKAGYIEFVKIILKNKLCNTQVVLNEDDDGKNALVLAIENNHPETAVVFIESPYYTEELLQTPIKGYTPYLKARENELADVMSAIGKKAQAKNWDVHKRIFDKSLKERSKRIKEFKPLASLVRAEMHDPNTLPISAYYLISACVLGFIAILSCVAVSVAVLVLGASVSFTALVSFAFIAAPMYAGISLLYPPLLKWFIFPLFYSSFRSDARIALGWPSVEGIDRMLPSEKPSSKHSTHTGILRWLFSRSKQTRADEKTPLLSEDAQSPENSTTLSIERTAATSPRVQAGMFRETVSQDDSAVIIGRDDIVVAAISA